MLDDGDRQCRQIDRHSRQCRQTAEGRWSCAGVSGDILSGDPIMIPALDTSDRQQRDAGAALE